MIAEGRTSGKTLSRTGKIRAGKMVGSRQTFGNHWIARTFAPSQAAEFPPVPGAYALVIRLDRPFCDEVGSLGQVELDPGGYVYLGSARGPGGLRARIRRHLRTEKKPHWHVDTLTLAGTVETILAVPGGSECDLVARLQALPGVTVPHPGFGSSDCRRCVAHLIAISGDKNSVRDRLASFSGVVRPGQYSL